MSEIVSDLIHDLRPVEVTLKLHNGMAYSFKASITSLKRDSGSFGNWTCEVSEITLGYIGTVTPIFIVRTPTKPKPPRKITINDVLRD